MVGEDGQIRCAPPAPDDPRPLGYWNGRICDAAPLAWRPRHGDAAAVWRECRDDGAPAPSAWPGPAGLAAVPHLPRERRARRLRELDLPEPTGDPHHRRAVAIHL